MFTHFGVTGPTVLSASAHLSDIQPGKYEMRIDLKPALDEKTLDARLLSDFEKYIPNFKKIVPNDYQRMMTEISRAEERGLNHDEAVLEAFYTTTGQKKLA